jgi:hypothetical protein
MTAAGAEGRRTTGQRAAWLAVVAGLVLCASPGRAQTVSDTAAAETLESAKREFQIGEFENAARLLRGLLETGVEDPTRRREALLYLGFSEVELGQPVRADEAFRGVLALDPDYRPDEREFPPKLRTAFEQSRAAMQVSAASDIVSLLEARGKLSRPGKMPAAFARKWYQKWWVYAIVGAVGVGATAVLAGGGSGYDPPTVALEVVTPQCAAPNPAGRYNPGAVAVEAQIEDGQGPYSLRFTDNDVEAGTLSTGASGTVRFTFPDLRSSPGGGCLNHVLRVTVTDAQDNGGRVVDSRAPIQVCQCFQ